MVDKSVHLLGTKNRISLSDFFERLKKLNLQKHDGRTQVDDNAYCTAKRKLQIIYPYILRYGTSNKVETFHRVIILQEVDG